MEAIYRFTAPTGPAAPLLVSVPHAGEDEPEDIQNALLTPHARRKRDFDLYVDRFWRDAPQHGAAFIVAKYSRYVLDLNRAPEDVDAGSVLDHPNPIGTYRRGLFWQVTAAGEPVQGAPLPQAAYAARVATYHQPYHAKLEATLAQIQDQFGHVLLIDAHSMPSVGRDDHPDPGQVRADIVPGTNLGRACPPDLVALCVDTFSAHGFSVAVDQPYKGGWITRHYGQPAAKRFALQIEVSRRVYMEEETFAIKDEGVAKLRAACQDFMGRAAAWRPGH